MQAKAQILILGVSAVPLFPLACPPPSLLRTFSPPSGGNDGGDSKGLGQAGSGYLGEILCGQSSHVLDVDGKNKVIERDRREVAGWVFSPTPCDPLETLSGNRRDPCCIHGWDDTLHTDNMVGALRLADPCRDHYLPISSIGCLGYHSYETTTCPCKAGGSCTRYLRRPA